MKGIDHGVCYENIIRPYLARPINILDIGAGTYDLSPSRLDRIACIHGVDPDSRIKENLNIDVPFVGTVEEAHYAPQYFDLISSRFVFEHVLDPIGVLNKIYTWLKPGGKVVILTVNKFHYYAILNRLLSEKVAGHLTSKKQRDVFPTHYNFNNPFRIAQIVCQSSFGSQSDVRCTLCEKYLYSSLSVIRVLSRIYSSIVNLTDLLKWFRAGLIIEITKSMPKPSSADHI